MGPPDQQGLYHLENGRLDLYLNEFSYPDHEFKGGSVRFDLSGDRSEKITDLDQNTDLALAELEPELITAFYDKDWEERNLVRLNELPPYLVDTILSIEDIRFYQHFGVDIEKHCQGDLGGSEEPCHRPGREHRDTAAR
jgi:penicillin-binding protein 1B